MYPYNVPAASTFRPDLGLLQDWAHVTAKAAGPQFIGVDQPAAEQK